MAKLIHPTIVKAVGDTLQKSVQDLMQELQSQAKCIAAFEQRISKLEDELT